LEEQFSFVQHVFEDYPVETREDALAEIFRKQPEAPPGHKPRIRSDHGVTAAIKHKGVSADYDNRDQFIELGRSLLAPVRNAIATREITPALIQQWGMLTFCHGYTAAHIFDDTDAFAQVRGEIKSRKSRTKTEQAAWLGDFNLLPLLQL
jgi:hypothetical protein